MNTKNMLDRFVQRVAYFGHLTDAGAAALLAEFGASNPRKVINAALAKGLVQRVDRLGGYAATSAGNAKHFGSASIVER